MVQLMVPAVTTTLPAVPPWGGTGGVTTIWPKVVRASRNKACFMRLLIFWFANAEAISGARSIVREVFILAFPFPAAHSHTLDRVRLLEANWAGYFQMCRCRVLG